MMKEDPQLTEAAKMNKIEALTKIDLILKQVSTEDAKKILAFLKDGYK